MLFESFFPDFKDYYKYSTLHPDDLKSVKNPDLGKLGSEWCCVESEMVAGSAVM